MPEKILFVDDEPPVLDGLKRMLHGVFAVDTAPGGEQALDSMRVLGPYAVVVSDMRMPGMNGAQFLAEVRRTAPSSVRMLLTGYTDWNAAIDAVNEGNIFRFLTKPCPKEALTNAIEAGLAQYRLVNAERDLLEHTLMGSIKVLADFLSVASPAAFGRSTRITACVRHLVGKFGLPSPWRFEAAAMLSQLGCVTLAPEVIQAAYAREKLSPEDQARFAAHPQVAKNLLVNIPRLEPVAWMIGQQLVKGIVPKGPELAADVVFGANVLKLAVAFDDLRLKGVSDEDSIASLRRRQNEFDPELVQALVGIKTASATMELRKLSTSKLCPGMILHQEIRTRAGMLVVGKGQEITHALAIKLDNFANAGTIDKEIMVMVPA